MPRIKKLLKQLGWSLIVSVVAGIPMWLWLGTVELLSPEGFWQNLMVAGVGLYLLGVQIPLFLLWLWLIYMIWFEFY